MRRLRYSFLLLLVVSAVLLNTQTNAVAQSRPRTTRTTKRTSAPRPDRRETLLLQVLAVQSFGQATVQATSSSTIEKPVDLTAPFPISLVNKAKLHFSNGRTMPFMVGDTIVVRTDFYGTPAAFQAAAREIWEIPIYAAEQRLRKEITIGTVFRYLSGSEQRGVFSVKRDDGTLAEFKVTEKSRFCRADRRVLPSTYQAGMTVAVKPRALPSGGAMVALVAESPEALDRAHKDTLTVWRGILERAEVPSFYIILRRDDGVRRKIRLPKVIRITDEADERKSVPGRVYQFAELIEKPIVVHLVAREVPDDDGTRTAEIISAASGKSKSSDAVEDAP